jgi:hypothetical protein
LGPNSQSTKLSDGREISGTTLVTAIKTNYGTSNDGGRLSNASSAQGDIAVQQVDAATIFL